MSDELIENPIPSAVQDLIAVFKNDLAGVSFPDVSQDTLESLAEKVKSSSRELQDAMRRVESARQSLEAELSELNAKAVRGLAYAKVFAEGNEDLQEKIGAINLGKANRSPKKAASEKQKAEKPQGETEHDDAQKPEDKKTAKAAKKPHEQA